jgi:hypothetical protein
MRYFSQALAESDPSRKDLLLDIATEELSHLEVIGSFAVVPLVMFTGDRKLMGKFVNPRWMQAAAGCVAALVAVINSWLVWQVIYRAGCPPDKTCGAGCLRVANYHKLPPAITERTAPLVLMLHGFCVSRHYWDNQVRALAAAGYFVLAPIVGGANGLGRVWPEADLRAHPRDRQGRVVSRHVLSLKRGGHISAASGVPASCSGAVYATAVGMTLVPVSAAPRSRSAR